MSRASLPTLRLATPGQPPRHASPQQVSPQHPPSTRAQLVTRSLETVGRIGRELFEATLYREATDLFRYLTMADPLTPAHWYWLGRGLTALGDPVGAAHVFELGGRLSHASHFADLAAEAWLLAGYPARAKAALELKGTTT